MIFGNNLLTFEIIATRLLVRTEMTPSGGDKFTRGSGIGSSLGIVSPEFFGVFFDGRNDGFGHLSKKRSGNSGEIVKHGGS